MVYCTTPGGAETEFPESLLMSEADWAAKTKTGQHREISYDRLKQSRHFLPASEKLDAAGAERLLAKAQRLSPGLLDFAALTLATRILVEHREEALIAQLSIRKCRAVFDAAPPAVRARLLADLLAARAEALVGAAALGDNLLTAMFAKGLEPLQAEYEAFQDRPLR